MKYILTIPGGPNESGYVEVSFFQYDSGKPVEKWTFVGEVTPIGITPATDYKKEDT